MTEYMREIYEAWNLAAIVEGVEDETERGVLMDVISAVPILLDELEKAKKERDEVKTIHSALCTQINQLEEKCEEHSNEADTYHDWWDSTKKERDELRKRVEELEDEVSQLNHFKNETKAAKDNLIFATGLYRAEVTKLKEQISKLSRWGSA